MNKSVVINTIQDNELAETSIDGIRLGDWVIINDKNLCVIAQVDTSMITAICIDPSNHNGVANANRMTKPFRKENLLDKLNMGEIRHFNYLDKSDFKMTKVNVEINVFLTEEDQYASNNTKSEENSDFL